MEKEKEVFLANIIKILHLFFIIFIFTGWYTDNILNLILYATTVLTLQVHWVANNDTCALTIMEQTLRGKKNKQETFFGKLVSPVYIIENEFQNQLSYLITSVLVVIVLYKLHFNNNLYKVIKSFKKGFRNGIYTLKKVS